ncbi:MAG TPA: ATP-dependent DNA helicase RecG, partial [Pyrinomonadaceae bacterium]|nr:ATP-dependent DNA helicase RecG [Pyrinomonadaceae bacterium]
MNLSLQTPIVELHKFDISRLSAAMARKLAASVANISAKSDLTDATVEDLLNYYPMRYENRSNFIGIDQLYDGIEASVELFTRVSGGFQVGKNRNSKQPPLYIFELSASDRDRTRKPVVVWWFLSGKQSQHVINYNKQRFDRGTRFVAYGKWEWDARRNTFALKLNKPDELEILPPIGEGDAFGLLKDAEPTIDTDGQYEADLADDAGDPRLAMIHTGRHVPVYRKLGPFQTKRLREIVYDITQRLDLTSPEENLPADLIKSRDLIPHLQAVAEIHFPPEDASLSDYEMFRSRAHKRLIYEEFFWLSFALQLKRGERQKDPKGAVIELSPRLRERIFDTLPFELTNAQDRVVRQIFGDMTSDAPMNRLIQGDVGSGKTIVAFMSIILAAENGYQAAMMAPTEILAEQHARNAERIFAGCGYRIGLLTGSTRAAAKRKLQDAIATGETQIVIGTHAVIQEAVQFENLGLAVIDEQHRFGVLQRAELRARGYNPDILVMTATPIPRSLAMTVYGDLDVSIIDELPPGRTPVKTVVLGEDQRAGVYKGIDREVKLGRQVYVVYPLIEQSEKVDLKAATKMFEELRDKVFPNFGVGLLHGKMKPADKEETMRLFVSGELNILVSTTVIEVGVDVPNASL